MKKLIIFVSMMLTIAFTAPAAENAIFMEYHRDSKSSNRQVRRTPMYFPIDVLYDFDTHTINIIGDNSVDAEVYIRGIYITMIR